MVIWGKEQVKKKTKSDEEKKFFWGFLGELKVWEGTHGTEPMGFRGGQVGLEKTHKTQEKKFLNWSKKKKEEKERK